MNFITQFLRIIIDWIYGIVNNYGVAIILFTLVVRLILLPLDLKQRKSTYKMKLVQPKIDEINQKYANDPEKKNRKTMELYQKEKISPFSGCLPLLIQFPVLIAMYSVMRHIAAEHFVYMFETVEAGGSYMPETFLWIHNLWQPDNIVSPIIPSLDNVMGILSTVKNNPIATPEKIEYITANYETVMLPLMESAQYEGILNGWAILPVLSGLTQLLQTRMMNQGTAQSAQNSTSKMMTYMFPIISVFFCWQYNAAFALYWVVSNIYSMISMIVINKIYDKKYGIVHEKKPLPAWMDKVKNVFASKETKQLPAGEEKATETEEP